MSLPEFLKCENKPEANKIEEEFDRMLKEYEELFGEELGTEPSNFSLKEWIEIIKECIRTKERYEELTGDVLDEDALL